MLLALRVGKVKLVILLIEKGVDINTLAADVRKRCIRYFINLKMVVNCFFLFLY